MEEKEKLIAEGVKVSDTLQVGIMIEIPALLLYWQINLQKK